MKITDILAKIGKGETLTDDEKAFAAGYNLQNDLDAAASGARKKAEASAQTAANALAALQAEFDEYKQTHNPAAKDGEIAKMSKRIETLEKARQDAEAKATALERKQVVAGLAKKYGITPAKGVAQETIDLLVGNLTANLDLEDADAVKSAFDTFKGANAGLIAAQTIGGADTKGHPSYTFNGGKNPFAKASFNLTEQIKVMQENPALAQTLKQEAAQV